MTCDASDAAGDPPITLKTILGIIWAKIGGGPGEGGCTGGPFDCIGSGGGVRGAPDARAAAAPAHTEFTLDTRRGLYHVISGTLVLKRRHGPPLPVPAGMSARVTKRGITLSTAWPAADQAMVPSASLPPKISGLKVKADSTRRPTVSFRISEPAKITIQIRRGARRITSLTRTRKAGLVRLAFHNSVPAGVYTLALSANARGLTTTVSAPLQVR
jgi:hypothetical protein